MIDYTAMAEQLHGEYRTIFEKAELYSDINGIQEEIKADRLMNLLDLLTTAEAEQKPAADIICSDIDTFCKDYFADYDIHSKISEIPERLYDLSKALLFVLLLDIFFLDHPTKNIIHMQSDIMPMIAGLLSGILLLILMKYIVGPIIYHSQKIPTIIYYVLVLVLFVVLISASVWLIRDKNIRMPSFPFLAASVSYIVIYLTARSIIRYRKTGSIRKPRLVDPEYEMHLTKPGGNETDMENAMQKGLVKRYRKINRKRSRKNQPAMTTQEFIDKIRKEDAIYDRLSIWGIGIFYLMLAGSILIGDIRNFGIGIGSLILLDILSAVYIPLFLFVRNCTLRSSKLQKKILETWETEGISILEQKKNKPGRETHP